MRHMAQVVEYYQATTSDVPGKSMASLWRNEAVPPTPQDQRRLFNFWNARGDRVDGHLLQSFHERLAIAFAQGQLEISINQCGRHAIGIAVHIANTFFDEAAR